MGTRTIMPLAVVVAAVGCRLAGPHVQVEPGVTFVAHEEHERIVIDHAPGGRPGALVPAAWLRGPGDPTWLLQSDGHRGAGFWLEGPGTVRVRATRSPTDPIAGRVDPTWEDGAIRLTIGGEGPAHMVGPFRRVVTGGGPSVLSRRAQTNLDVRGTYQADLLDGQGKPVGWWRLRISPYAPAPRIYEAVLPDPVDLPLAAATAIALGAEVDWIEAHVLDVYRGDSSGGRLERSIPLGR